MSDYFIYVLIAIIVIVGVWFIFAKVLKNKKPKEVTLKKVKHKERVNKTHQM
jgi:undecaprenyl pyrophosphate phosphatase UppP